MTASRTLSWLSIAAAISALAIAGLGIWLPDWLFDSSFVPHLMGHKRLLRLQPNIPHSSELRAALLQTALAFGGVALACQGLVRKSRTIQNTWANLLQTPVGLALLTYSATVAWTLPGLLGEQHFDGHSAVHQAASFLRGELHLDRYVNDTVRIHGQHFSIFPPLPAVALLPLVALFGTSAKTLLLTPLLAGVTAYCARQTLTQLKLEPLPATWCCIGLLFGTAWISVAGHGTDTYLAHCVATTCLMLALWEATGRGRGWAIGLMLGCAFLSRQLTILLTPFFILSLAAPGGLVQSRPTFVKGKALALQVLALATPLVACMAIYGLLNWLRTGDAANSSYSELVEHGWYQYRADKFGQFHPSYVPSNLIRLLVLGPGVEFEGYSYMVPKMTGFGSSLTFTSPFLFFAAARGNLGWVGMWRAAWVSIGAVLTCILLHKSALGGYQTHGLRYTLDLTPLLFVLASLKIGQNWKQDSGVIARWLIGYSVVVAAVALHGLPTLRTWLQQLPH